MFFSSLLAFLMNPQALHPFLQPSLLAHVMGVTLVYLMGEI